MTSRMLHKSSFGSTGNRYNMFFASLLLHLIVMAAIFVTVPGASRQLTFGASYFVALVGPEVMASPQAGPQDVLQAPSAASPVILKRNNAASETVVFKKKDTGRQDIEKAINALKQKALAKTDSKTEKTPAVAPGPGVPAPRTENQSQIDNYSRFVWSKVKKNWTLPAALMPKNNVEAVIEVRIAQSGAVEYIGFEKRSGNNYFDESALRAVKKSIPFPSLGGWATGRTIEIGIRFHSAELR